METTVTNNFSIVRSLDVMKKIIVEQPRANIMKLILLFGVLSMISILVGTMSAESYDTFTESKVSDPAINIEIVFWTLLLFLFGSVYASTAFSKLSTRSGRISMISLPANSSEKFLAYWFIHTIVFLVLFAAAIEFADALRVAILKLVYPYSNSIHFIKLSNFLNNNPLPVITFYLMYQSFFLLGSIVWPRFSFLKTYAALTIIGGIYLLTAIFFVPVTGHNGLVYVIRMNEIHIDKIITFTSIAVCLVNYGLTYLRIRETEVIDRL